MTVTRIFNTKYIETVQNLSTAFSDNTQLMAHCMSMNEEFNRDEDTQSIHIRFKNNVDQTIIDKILLRDIELLTNQDSVLDKIFECDICSLIQGMEEGEIDAFWKCMSVLCKYSSMIRACGDNLNCIEDVAKQYINKNKCDPKELQQKLMADMFSGGELSNTISNMFSDPKMLSSMMVNMGNILKCKDGGDSDNQLKDLFDMVQNNMDTENSVDRM